MLLVRCCQIVCSQMTLKQRVQAEARVKDTKASAKEQEGTLAALQKSLDDHRNGQRRTRTTREELQRDLAALETKIAAATYDPPFGLLVFCTMAVSRPAISLCQSSHQAAIVMQGATPQYKKGAPRSRGAGGPQTQAPRRMAGFQQGIHPCLSR